MSVLFLWQHRLYCKCYFNTVRDKLQLKHIFNCWIKMQQWYLEIL